MPNRVIRRLAAVLACVSLFACAPAHPPASYPGADRLDAIEADLARHIAVLASDEFEGRKPGTEGEAKTLRYLVREWQAAGLESGTNDPANPWFAPVELILTRPAEQRAVLFDAKGRVVGRGEDLHLFTADARSLIERAPVTWFGSNAVAPARTDQVGHIALAAESGAAARGMREALVQAGAAAIIWVVDDPERLEALLRHRKAGQYSLKDEAGVAPIEGYVSREDALRMFGPTLAHSPPSPAKLPLRITLEAESSLSTVRTHNLIGRLPGTVPGSGAVLVLAHWDHFGDCVLPPAADTICNGAVDNASGLAVATELAHLLGNGSRPERDVYFLATTAEEWGLLGALAFARSPPVPLETIKAAFNIDSIAIAPRGSPVAVVGRGLTGMDAAVDAVIAGEGRSAATEDYNEEFLRRQDGWALLQRDVPTLAVSSAYAAGDPFDHFTAQRYHRPTDEAEGLELGGAAQDLLLHLALVRHFANVARWPGDLVRE